MLAARGQRPAKLIFNPRGFDLREGARANGNIFDPTVTRQFRGNYKETKLTRVGVAPVPLTPVNAAGAPLPGGPIALSNATSRNLLGNGSPKVKVIGGIFYDIAWFSATLRETFFGTTCELLSPDGGAFFPEPRRPVCDYGP